MRAELYKFERGTTVYTLTSSDEEQEYESEIYEPAVIGHGNRENQTELSKENLEVKINLEHPMANDLLTYFGDDIMILTLFIKLDSGVEVGWKGRYVSQKPLGNQLSIIIESVFTSLRRPGLRARYQKTCRHALYRTLGCKLNVEDFAYESILDSILGRTLIVSGASLQPDGFYIGGMIRASSDNSLRWIVNHVGDTLTLVRSFEKLEEDYAGYGVNYGGSYGGTIVKIYPGCDHTRATCISKFDNVLNYGGFPWIPGKNPMGETSIV